MILQDIRAGKVFFDPRDSVEKLLEHPARESRRRFTLADTDDPWGLICGGADRRGEAVCGELDY